MRVLLLFFALVAACTPARREVDGNIVRDIAFEGNSGAFSGQNDYQLRSHMVQQETKLGLLLWPLIYTVDPKPLVSGELTRDAYRLEVWYAHHGWFDARFHGWTIRRIRDASERRAGVLDVIGSVEPGPRSLVREIRIDGMDAALKGIQSAVLKNGPIREGDPFDLELVELLRQQLVDELHDRARAYAKAELRIDAHPEDLVVDVLIVVDVGPVCRFGEITVAGATKVPERFVRQKLGIEEGDGYSLSLIRTAQRRLFEVGTFSIATVEPDLSDRTQERVPLSVRVTESRFRTFRIGFGGTYDSFLPQARISSRIGHVNLGHQLIRAELGGRVGYAFALERAEGPARIPVWGADVSAAYPRLWQQRGTVELVAEIEQDVFSGLWAYRRPQADLDIVYRFSDDVQVRVGPHIERYEFLYDYLGDSVQVRNAQLRLFGVEDQEDFSYQLQALDQFAIWDWRDDEMRTTRGAYYTVSARESLAIGGLGYGFIRLAGEGRWFTSPRAGGRVSPITLVGRARGTAIALLPGSDVVPLPERAYLGGATSIRGFRPSQVGPYVTLVTTEDVETGGFLGGPKTLETRETRYHLPDGGTFSIDTSAELRYQLDGTRVLAAFVDVGFLASDLPDLVEQRFDLLRVSAGVGGRYDTLVGPFRLDLSFRPLYPEDLGARRVTGCPDCEVVPRAQDFFGNFTDLRQDKHPPLAMVFFVTIGESI